MPSQNKGILNKGHDVVISIIDVTSKILSRDSNYIVDVIMWPNFDSVSMKEVVIASIL